MSYERSATIEALRLRAGVLARLRAFFAARSVLEVETPALSPAGVTDPALANIAAEVRSLGGIHYLHTSPEFAMKRLLADGVGDIYQICRVFRDDELGRRHQPEFTLLEWYRVGWNDERLMDEVAEAAYAALDRTARDWPVVRLSYREAFVRATGVDPLSEIDAPLRERLDGLGVEVPAGLDAEALLDLAFGTVVEPALPREALTFIYDYPAAQAALAKLKPGRPPVAARFELFAGGVELANGFAELTDAAEQRRRFAADRLKRQRQGRPEVPMDEDFLAALEAGLPECAGVALGVDRLVALAAGATHLAEVLAFTHRPRRDSAANAQAKKGSDSLAKS
ncbi:MAG TPA: EF-P lysine aminoacylase EpmA [Gammaproteobacteria bacterium]|nr:EF-P lysine aminoacylase EpmA [Gammaproteobacteria bacterium]